MVQRVSEDGRRCAVFAARAIQIVSYGRERVRPECRAGIVVAVLFAAVVTEATVDRYTVATIDRRLSSIGYYHKQARHGLPTKDPEVERTMHGIRRAKGIAPNDKAPI